MGKYIAPFSGKQFFLSRQELLHIEETLRQLPMHAKFDLEGVNQALGKSGKFTIEILLPLNHSGNLGGRHLNKGRHVFTTNEDLKKALRQFVKAGWPTSSCDPGHGRRDVPLVVNYSFFEMLNSESHAWNMCPGLLHSTYPRAAIWRNGAVLDLGTLGGNVSVAYAVNNLGQVVGHSTANSDNHADWQAFVWNDGTIINLNRLLPADSGWNLQTATGINDVGQIVGRGMYDGIYTSFILALQ